MQTRSFSIRVLSAVAAVTSAAEFAWSAGGAEFTNHDVGDVAVAGAYGQSNGVFTVLGGGEDIEGTADAFHFVHQSLIGDGQVMARVLSIQGADQGAEAGVMMRTGLNAGAQHVLLALSMHRSVAFRRRHTAYDYAVDNWFAGTNSAWFCVMRMGNTFVGHYSTNGTQWKYLWHSTLNLPSQLEVGLAVTAHKYSLVATGRFDNVSVGGLTPLSGVWLEAGPRIYLGGEPYAYPPLQQLGGFKMLIGGAVGDRYTIQASADVSAPGANWLSVGSVTNTWGVLPLLDPQALGNSRRFYRVVTTVTNAPTVIASGLNYPYYLTLDGSYVYFADSSASDGILKRVPKGGGSVSTLATGLATWETIGPNSFAVSGGTIYGGYGGYNAYNVFAVPSTGGSASTLFSPTGGSFIGVSGSLVYFSRNFNYISSIPTSGGSPTQLAANIWVRESRMDSSAIYFQEYFSKDVMKCSLPSGAVTTLIGGNSTEGNMFLDAANVYFILAGNIRKVPKSGGSPTMLVSSGNVSGDGVSDGTRVYFLEGNRIKSIPVGGGSPSTLIDIPAGSLSSRGLEVDDAFIYWTDTSGGAGAGRIWRMPKQ